MYFLPLSLRNYVIENYEILHELRIRKNQPVTANLANKFTQVKTNGKIIVADQVLIDSIVNLACHGSFYLHNESIKNGYITCGNGVRIGIGGECVVENGFVKTIKNLTSLCIRFPHEVKGCANETFKIIDSINGIKNLLVISPPGVGKTTLIRDLARIISNKKLLNILLIDEKNELFYDSCDVGSTTDVIKNCNKKFGFYTAIKTLNPHVIICDEIINSEDVDGAIFAVRSGVKIICTVHGCGLDDVKQKEYLKKFFTGSVFEKYVKLTPFNNGFKEEEVFD